MTAPDVDSFVEVILSYDGPLGELKHEYDPAKAKEYYLRTRELKGRKKGSVLPPSSKRVATVRPMVKSRKSNAAEIKKAAEARVAALKGRLDKLEKVLDELTKQAKARSGVNSGGKAPAKTNPKDSKPQTAAQKRDAAKKAKEYRDKNDKDGDPSLAAEAKQLDAKIKKVRERIAKMKAQIANAKKKTQAISKSDAKPNKKNGIERPLNETKERR